MRTAASISAMWRGRLAWRIVLYMVLASALLSVLAAGFQLYSSYRRDMTLVNAELLTVENNFVPRLNSVLVGGDTPLIDALLDGIVSQAHIAQVELKTGSGQAWRRGVLSEDEDTMNRVFQLIGDGGNDSSGVEGVLSVTVSLDGIHKRLWDQLFALILSNFGKTLFASMVMVFIFDRMVSRHLRRLADLAGQSVRPGGETSFNLNRNGHREDELGQIVNALNAFTVRVGHGQRALRVRSQELQAVNAQMHDTNREQAEFTYAISHDLKAPINTMAMLVSELGECLEEGEDCVDVLADMQTTNHRMGQLVEDVLSYSRIVEECVQTKVVDLDALIAATRKDLAADIAAAGATIEAGHLGTIDGHPMHLRILFQNLISNAIKFRSLDRPSHVRITRSIDEWRQDVITIADNGIGIPEEHRNVVFGLFKRLHTRASYDGSGLGLAICRRVMSSHGGTIQIGSGMDGGAAFTLTFWADEDGQYDRTGTSD